MEKFIVKCGSCREFRVVEAKENIDFVDEDGLLRSTPLDRPRYACFCGSEDVEISREVK